MVPGSVLLFSVFAIAQRSEIDAITASSMPLYWGNIFAGKFEPRNSQASFAFFPA